MISTSGIRVPWCLAEINDLSHPPPGRRNRRLTTVGRARGGRSALKPITARMVASDPLAVWYVEAESCFSDLSECCDLVRAIAASSTASHPDLAELSAMVQQVEVWRLGNPSPDRLHGDYLGAVLDLFASLGWHLLGFGGALSGPEQAVLDERVDKVLGAVDDLRWLRQDRIAEGLRLSQAPIHRSAPRGRRGRFRPVREAVSSMDGATHDTTMIAITSRPRRHPGAGPVRLDVARPLSVASPTRRTEGPATRCLGSGTLPISTRGIFRAP